MEERQIDLTMILIVLKNITDNKGTFTDKKHERFVFFRLILLKFYLLE